MKNYNAKNVNGYISSAEKTARPHLKEIRKIIKSTIPKVEEKISWGIPFYRYQGYLVGFAAFKNHVGFGFANVFQGNDRKLLEKKGYETGSKTIQIRFNQKVPVASIRKILKARAKKNEAEKSMK